MDFSNINFTHDCFVDLHVEGYGSVSGMSFSAKDTLVLLAQLFKESHDWQHSFERNGKQYVMSFVDAGNLTFNKFMQDEVLKENERAEVFYRNNGFYEQTHDFFDVWDDNNIIDVRINFPIS